MNDTERAGAETYRVGRHTLREDAPILALLAADLVFGLVTWNFMPARVPVHFGLSGQPDRWGPAWMNALLLPLVA